MADDAERPHSHLIAFPEALEAFFTRIPELKVVLGPQAAADVDGLDALIRDGLAARDRGDTHAAVTHVVRAMERLAELASRSDAAEGPLLRAMALRFAQALGRGAVSEAHEAADVMRERSGSRLIPRRRP